MGLPEHGWVQVDPTGGGKVTPGLHAIPYVASEDGEMPILYLTYPSIEIVTP